MIRIFSVLIFLLIREVYSANLCLTEKYRKYEVMFKYTYNALSENPVQLNFTYFQSISDFINSLSLNKCDLAMVEPIFYNEYYNTLEDISNDVADLIKERTNDEIDGEIYSELLKDLKSRTEEDDEAPIKALPLFLDYGILYYRSDLESTPAKTWDELRSLKEWVDPIESDIYIGQFNEYRDFYYNLMENVLNTDSPLSYDVIERETNHTIGLFKDLFDEEIINEYAWHLNSEYGLLRFISNKVVYMRNWSSYLYNVTMEYKKKQNEGKTFAITKTLYSDDRTQDSKTINKGIYLCIPGKVDGKKWVDVPAALDVLKIFSSKEFMKNLLQYDDFYDIPAYRSLILEDDGSINNKKYCERINCEFFRDLSKDLIIATYDIFYQKDFLSKLFDFYEKTKIFLNKDSSTLKELMDLFSNYFEDKYIEYNSSSSIIMMIIVSIEILITLIILFYIIKYRSFIEIRRSSPLFLIMMLCGIILAFLSIFTYIGKPTKTVCILRPYLLVIAFGLTFYSLLLKTFRIKVIFDKVNIQVKDSNLIMYLLVILGIELILVTVWSAIGGMEPDIRTFSKEIHYYICMNTSKTGEIIQIILISINGLALLYGCYLAYKVKNVYSEYNESKVIGLSIYGIVICMVILMFIGYINGLNHLTLFLVQSLMIILSADIILVFMFTPKLWKLHINIISEMQSSDNSNNNKFQSNDDNDNTLKKTELKGFHDLTKLDEFIQL